MKNNKHIDEFFREKLGRYSETPPADAWGDLDKKLDTLVPHVPTSPFKWLGHAAMVTIIAVLGVSVVPKFTGSEHNSTAVNHQDINQLASSTATSFNTNGSVASVNATAIPEHSDNSNEDLPQGNTGAADEQVAMPKTDDNKDGNQAAKRQPQLKQISVNAGSVADRAGSSLIGSPSQPAGRPSDQEGEITPAPTLEQFNSAADQEANRKIEKKEPVANPTPIPAKSNVLKPEAIAKKELGHNRKKPDFARFEAGMKLGYEKGLNAISATKYVFAPYIQYNFSSRISVMLQPAAKYANSPVRTIGSAKSYNSVNDDGTVTDMGTKEVSYTDGSSTSVYYQTTFRYSQSHDSVVKTNTYGGRYLEFELPVLLKYNLSKKTSVYGGVNMVYSKTTGVKENTFVKSGIRSMADTTIEGALPKTKPDALPINEVITYNGTPFSEYNGPLYPAAQSSQVRFGALLGITYEYSDRWLLDALIQQNPAPKDMRGGYNINAPLSATYFRLSVGYKLTK